MNRIFTLMVAVSLALPAFCQNADRRDVRKGNRDFRKENYKGADIDYRKALVKDSTSVAANYNLANTLYKMSSADVSKYYDAIKDTAPATPYGADYYFNVGDAAVAAGNWQAAVDAFKNSLLLRPDDIDAKENYIYAKKKLEDQQNNQDQNQNQNNQDNQDQNQNQNQNNQDQNNKDQNNQNNQDQNQDQNNQDQNQGQQPQISPQAAQQMLQAIQAKEKETQDKVNKEKAAVLKSRQKEKNW